MILLILLVLFILLLLMLILYIIYKKTIYKLEQEKEQLNLLLTQRMNIIQQKNIIIKELKEMKCQNVMLPKKNEKK